MKLNSFFLFLIVLALNVCENYVSCQSSNIKESELKRVAALLQTPMYGKAQLLFNEINNVSFIEPIMEEMYPNPTFEVMSMASFIDILTTMPRRIQAYQKWESLVRADGKLLDPWIIVLKKRLSLDIVDSPEPALKLIKTRADVYAGAVVVKWANEILSGKTSSVIEFGSPRSISIVGHAFTDEIETLVKKLFEILPEEEKFTKTLEFVLQLRWDIQKLIGLITLQKDVNKLEQIILIGAHLSNLEKKLTGPDDPEDVKDKFKYYWNSNTTSFLIKHMFWHDSCTLKTKNIKSGDDEYMTVMDVVEDGNREVRNKKGSGSPFRLEHRLDEETIRFNIVSKVESYQEKYLDFHTDNNLMDEGRFRVVTFRKAITNYHWVLEIIDSTKSDDLSIRISHEATNRYLGGKFPNATIDNTEVVLFELAEPLTFWNLKCTIPSSL